MSKPVVLCVDDERIILSSLKSQLLNSLGDTYQIELAESGEEALEIIEELRENRTELPLIIADQIMGGMYGDELLTTVKTLSPETHSIMLTGQASAESVGKAVNKAGLFRYISKPWEEEDLLLTVQTALQSYYHQQNILRQDCYQNALNQILQRVLAPISFEEQLSQALTIILSTRCFNDLNKGSIYVVDIVTIVDVEGVDTSVSEPLDLKLISQVSHGDAPNHAKDFTESDKTVQLVDENKRGSSNIRYYRAPILLQDQVLGFLYLYVSPSFCDVPQTKAFLSSVCHTLAGMIRLSQYNLTLKKHSEGLEKLVEKRTKELHQALRKQEQLNDIFLEANKKLDYFATTDELTGLMNRRCFFEQADKEASRAQRYGRKTVLVMLDIDFFKEVNDSFGHQAGDKVLNKLALVMSDSMREHDIIGRVGGEEFAIVMPETDITKGEELCERIRLAISSTEIMINSQGVSVSVSIGISEVRLDEITISGAMIRADQALYDSKHQGRNLISRN